MNTQSLAKQQRGTLENASSKPLVSGRPFAGRHVAPKHSKVSVSLLNWAIVVNFFLQTTKQNPNPRPCLQASAAAASNAQKPNAASVVAAFAAPLPGSVLSTTLLSTEASPAQQHEVEAQVAPASGPIVADMETILQERDACGVSGPRRGAGSHHQQQARAELECTDALVRPTGCRWASSQA